MKLTPGALVAGRYRVERKVGSGGMGEVWAGEHVFIGLRVALKTLLPAATIDHQIVARFKREAYLLGRIRSDYVAKVVDFVSDDQFGMVLVMAFVEGEELGKILDSRRLGVEETIDIGIDIASALCDLHHAHVVHRDLKPENIILDPLADGRRRAMIVDFGVGRMISSNEEDESQEELTGITHADMALGTIAYMAPEQLLSSRDVTGASDIYALGAILYRAAAGKHVFGSIEEPDYTKKKLFGEAEELELPRFDRVAKGLQRVVARALMRRPSDRFESAKQMLDDLVALRDVARMMMLDLEGITEEVSIAGLLGGMAPPDSLLPPPPPPARVSQEPPISVVVTPSRAGSSADLHEEDSSEESEDTKLAVFNNPTSSGQASLSKVVPTPASRSVSSATASPVKTASGPSPVKTASGPSPVKTASAPSPVKTASGPSPVKTASAPSPVKTASGPSPVKTASGPSPVKTASAPSPVKTASGPSPVKMPSVPAPARSTLAPLSSGPLSSTGSMMPRRVALTAILVALLSGVVLGFFAHWLLAAAAAPPKDNPVGAPRQAQSS